MLSNHISSMTHSVMSVNIGEYLLVKYTPIIWVYPRTTRRALNWLSLVFLKNCFDSIIHLFGGIFLHLILLHQILINNARQPCVLLDLRDATHLEIMWPSV